VLAPLNVPGIRKSLTEGGNKDFEIVELDGLNHMFQTSQTGLRREYVTIQETFNPAALAVIGIGSSVTPLRSVELHEPLIAFFPDCYSSPLANTAAADGGDLCAEQLAVRRRRSGPEETVGESIDPDWIPCSALQHRTGRIESRVPLVDQ
jgi:hypothetical protein